MPIFIGGGASDPGVLDAAVAALRPGGRLVVNAVTLETEALLIARHAALGGELIRIAIARAEPIGRPIAIADGVASGAAGHPMDVGEAMIVAGIGCRKGAAAAQIEAAIAAALARAGLGIAAARAVATSAAKGDEPGIAAAAAAIGVPLRSRCAGRPAKRRAPAPSTQLRARRSR